jgi:hydrogenase nickel incorporation protein HypA/HybF
MHELALAESMLAIAKREARRAGLQRITTIRLEIGRLSCVAPEALRFCFNAVTRGSIAEGAALEIISVPGAGSCPLCGRSFPLVEPYGVCADCGAPLTVTAGTEMRVRELEAA